VPGGDRHPPSRDLLRTKLAETPITELSDGFREQPAQLLDRLRLRVVLGEYSSTSPASVSVVPVPFARRTRSSARSSDSLASRSEPNPPRCTRPEPRPPVRYLYPQSGVAPGRFDFIGKT
jgi:hypothetical protein